MVESPLSYIWLDYITKYKIPYTTTTKRVHIRHPLAGFIYGVFFYVSCTASCAHVILMSHMNYLLRILTRQIVCRIAYIYLIAASHAALDHPVLRFVAAV